MDANLQELNEQYAIPGQVSFHHGPGELVMAVINNAHARATVTLAGGHVLTYTPHGGRPLLWVSPNASYTLGRAMRGGVPVCWPWFGPHPTDPRGKPQHGLVRTRLWSAVGTRALPDGATELRLAIADTPETLALWPYAFRLELTVTVGPRLRVGWTATNPGSQPYQYSGALHPYFSVGDIGAVSVRGLEGTDYLDKEAGMQRRTQTGPVRFTGPTDRVYLHTAAPLAVEDPGLGRVIHIAKQGSRTSVVWNPAEQDAAMPDVGPGQHQKFVCVEAANAADDLVTIAPGGDAGLAMEIWTEK